MVLQELCHCYENYMFPEAEAPPGNVKYLQCVDEKKSSLFSQMLPHFLKIEAGVHLYNDPLIIHVICIILLFCF